jgi:hypothetical protein
MNTISLKNLRIQGKKPSSFGIPINARRPVITPDAFPLLKNSSPVLCKSTHTHFHHFTPSRLPLPGKNPKAMANKGKTPREENNLLPKK